MTVMFEWKEILSFFSRKQTNDNEQTNGNIDLKSQQCQIIANALRESLITNKDVFRPLVKTQDWLQINPEVDCKDQLKNIEAFITQEHNIENYGYNRYVRIINQGPFRDGTWLKIEFDD